MKFMIIVLFAVILAVNATASQNTDGNGGSAPAVKQTLVLPMSAKSCDPTTCVSDCQDVGFAYGNCENGRCICTN